MEVAGIEAAVVAVRVARAVARDLRAAIVRAPDSKWGRAADDTRIADGAVPRIRPAVRVGWSRARPAVPIVPAAGAGAAPDRLVVSVVVLVVVRGAAPAAVVPGAVRAAVVPVAVVPGAVPVAVVRDAVPAAVVRDAVPGAAPAPAAIKARAPVVLAVAPAVAVVLAADAGAGPAVAAAVRGAIAAAGSGPAAAVAVAVAPGVKARRAIRKAGRSPNRFPQMRYQARRLRPPRRSPTDLTPPSRPSPKASSRVTDSAATLPKRLR